MFGKSVGEYFCSMTITLLPVVLVHRFKSAPFIFFYFRSHQHTYLSQIFPNALQRILLRNQPLNTYLSIDFTDEVSSKMSIILDEDNKRVWSCNECYYRKKSRTDVKRHIECKHLNLAFNCQYCFKIMSSSNALRNHIKNFHAVNSQPYDSLID